VQSAVRQSLKVDELFWLNSKNSHTLFQTFKEVGYFEAEAGNIFGPFLKLKRDGDADWIVSKL
jgi:hypothetical protein